MFCDDYRMKICISTFSTLAYLLFTFAKCLFFVLQFLQHESKYCFYWSVSISISISI